MRLSFPNFGPTSGKYSERDRILHFEGTLKVGEEFCYLEIYHPYRGGSNPLFDDVSRRILDLKDGVPSAVKHYQQVLVPLIYAKVPLFVVPSSDPQKTTTGIRRLVRNLTALGHWPDQNYNLYRKFKIDKYANGGTRDFRRQFDSLGLRMPETVTGQDALIIDDVTTTGTTFSAARKHLLDAGARRVYCLALGKTA